MKNSIKIFIIFILNIINFNCNNNHLSCLNYDLIKYITRDYTSFIAKQDLRPKYLMLEFNKYNGLSYVLAYGLDSHICDDQVFDTVLINNTICLIANNNILFLKKSKWNCDSLVNAPAFHDYSIRTYCLKGDSVLINSELIDPVSIFAPLRSTIKYHHIK